MTLLTTLYLLNGQDAILATVETTQAQSVTVVTTTTLEASSQTANAQQSSVASQLNLGISAVTGQSNTILSQLFIRVATTISSNTGQSANCVTTQELKSTITTTQIQTSVVSGSQNINGVENSANTNTFLSSVGLSVPIQSSTHQVQTNSTEATEQILVYTDGNTTQTALSDAYIVYNGVETANSQGINAIATLSMLAEITSSNSNTSNTNMFIRYSANGQTSQAQTLTSLCSISLSLITSSWSTQTPNATLKVDISLANDTSQSNTVVSQFSQELSGYNSTNSAQTMFVTGIQSVGCVISTHQTQTINGSCSHSYVGFCETTTTNSCFIPCNITIVYYNNKTPRPVLNNPVYKYSHNTPSYDVRTRQVPQTQQYTLPVIKQPLPPYPETQELKIVTLPQPTNTIVFEDFKVKDVPQETNEYSPPIIYPP